MKCPKCKSEEVEEFYNDRDGDFICSKCDHIFTPEEDKTMKFKLEIELGNVAMDSHEDIADALIEVGKNLLQGNDHTTIRDLNGNTVGKWEITK